MAILLLSGPERRAEISRLPASASGWQPEWTTVGMLRQWSICTLAVGAIG